MKTNEVNPLSLQAREHIRAGIEWLTEYASDGWEFRLLAFGENGQAWCVARDSHSDGCALALAFGERKDLVSKHGFRVSYASVMQHFGLNGKHLTSLGFHYEQGIPTDVFDKLWEHELFKHLAKRSTEQREHAAA